MNGSLTWTKGGSCVRIARHVPDAKKQPKRVGKRKRVTDFSASSRSRLKRVMSSVKRKALERAFVVTLTYPKAFPAAADFGLYKGHLHTFGVAARREFPECSFVWKLEFQRRGAPHYHLLLFGAGELSNAREWIAATWYRIAHDGDVNKGKAGTQCDAVISPSGAAAYLTTYLGKSEQALPGNFTGRYWGIIGREKLPLGELQNIEVPDDVVKRILRLARRKVKADVERSRWKHLLNKGMGKTGMTRFSLETALSQRATRRSCTLYRHQESIDLGGGMVTKAGLVRTDISTRCIKPPARYRPRRNDVVHLVCDVSQFLRAVQSLEKPIIPF